MRKNPCSHALRGNTVCEALRHGAHSVRPYMNYHGDHGRTLSTHQTKVARVPAYSFT